MQFNQMQQLKNEKPEVKFENLIEIVVQATKPKITLKSTLQKIGQRL